MINQREKKKIDKLSVIAIIIPIILIILDLANTIVMIGILLFQAIILLIKIKKNEVPFTSKYKKILQLLIIFWLLTYLIDIYGRYLSSTFITTTLVFVNIILIFMITCYTNNKINTFYTIMKIFIIFVVLLCIYGLFVRVLGGTPRPYTNDDGVKQYMQSVHIGPITLYQRAMGDSLGRFGVTSLTKNPNTFSYLILYAFVINLVIIKIRKNNKEKNIINYILIILFLISVYIAGSRLAMILIPISFILVEF